MSIYSCPFEDCGRRFKEEARLIEHLDRRHGFKGDLKEMLNPNLGQEKTETGEKTVEIKKEDYGRAEMELQNELERLDDLEEELRIVPKDVAESKKRLTEDFILEKSGMDTLEDVTQLILRDENLYAFESTATFDINKIGGVEYLSMSHNKIFNLLGISRLVNLIELNINFNLVEDLTPLSDCLNLEKLYASNNRIKSIAGIKELTNLKVLGLFQNKIRDFDETIEVLSVLKNLKELDLDHNPCSRKFSYKYDLLYYVKLELLDGERVQEIDYELAKSFRADTIKKESEDFDAEEQSGSVPQSGLQRPSTAPGRIKKANFATKLKSTAKQYKIPELIGIPEQVNSEEVGDLEREVEKLRNAKNQLEVDLDQSRANEKLLQLENERLQNENAILKVEANNSYILIDQNAALKKELESLRTIVGGTSEIKMLKEENLLLHEKLAEILKENRELSTLSSRKSTKDLDMSRNSERSMERETLETTMSTVASTTARSNNFRIKGTSGSTIAPKTRLIAATQGSRSNSQNPSRGNSVDREKTPRAPVVARKIIQISNPVKEKNEEYQEKAPNAEDQALDSEIEALLIRNSLTLSQLRSELRDFDFMRAPTEKRKFSVDDDDGDVQGASDVE